MVVIKVGPWWTSITCPKCSHCEVGNRNKNNRDDFMCLKCGYKGHADLDVATSNLEKVAITGENLVGPVREEKKPKRIKNMKKLTPVAYIDKTIEENLEQQLAF